MRQIKSMVDLIKEVIEKDGLKKRNREQHIVHRRIFLFNLLREKGYTFEYIARLFNMNHATVLHGIKRYKDLLSINDVRLQIDTERYAQKFDDLEAAVIKYNLEKDVRKATTLTDLNIIKRRLNNNLYD
ncbi:MAG TPA: hypothetical protein DCE27_10180 [Xanthomarina gelatinilytica]|nr:hypothetical protein [Xanthomarina gelatinilytica]|tara:strand:+ start:544 stop:930 length:387 start_codon:yes stop_codon:yes gene_type:complete